MISMYRIGSVTLLAGSVHFLPEGAELPDELNKAYESKSALVMEANIEECDSSLEELEESSLQDLISVDCFRRVLAAFENLGRDPEEAETLKPWACARWLQAATLERAGFLYRDGVDEQLRSRAIGDGKPVHSLEPADTVLRSFDAMPNEQQRQMLNKMLDEVEKVYEDLTYEVATPAAPARPGVGTRRSGCPRDACGTHPESVDGARSADGMTRPRTKGARGRPGSRVT